MSSEHVPAHVYVRQQLSFWVFRGVGGGRKKGGKKKDRAARPRRLALVRATPCAKVDVISAQLCSCTRAIFPWVVLFWSARSLPLMIVDNSPNMHNTGFFPDCWLLSVTNGSIWIPYLARYSEIFKETQFSGSKMEVQVHLKNAFPGGIGNRRISFGYNLWFSFPLIFPTYGMTWVIR